MGLIISKYLGEFSAAHQLVGHPGQCASLHGHNYGVQIGLEINEYATPDDQGIFVDFAEFKKWKDEIWRQFDHKVIYGPERKSEFGDGPNFVGICRAPSAEGIAVTIAPIMRAYLEEFNSAHPVRPTGPMGGICPYVTRCYIRINEAHDSFVEYSFDL